MKFAGFSPHPLSGRYKSLYPLAQPAREALLPGGGLDVGGIGRVVEKGHLDEDDGHPCVDRTDERAALSASYGGAAIGADAVVLETPAQRLHKAGVHGL